jgi:hypothetical protein
MKRSLVLQLLVSVILISGAATAHEVDSLYRVYDDGKTQVRSPHLEISGDLGKQMSLRLGFAQDITTSASSDVVSYSSHGSITDTRTEGSASFSADVDGGKFGLVYIRSQEIDYLSNIYVFSGSRELFEKNTTLFGSFSYGNDLISSSTDPATALPMSHETVTVGLNQVFSQESIAEISYDLRVENGYLSSPYRRARLLNPDGSGALVPIPENHPTARNRNALTFKYNFYSNWLDVSFANVLRAYLDNWGVSSGTFEERVTKKFGAVFDLALTLRYYQQQKAFFYEDKYETLGLFFSGNKTLATYDTLTLGLRPTLSLFDGIQIFAKYEIYQMNFRDHTDAGNLAVTSDDTPLKIQASIISLGVQGEF